MTAPVPYRWNGEAFEPLSRFKAECDRVFAIGEVHVLEPHEERSGASHRFYFAAIREAWMNLSDEMAQRFRSPEALRKYALIRAGYADSTSHVAGSKAEAQRLATFIQPIDEFAIVTVEGATVTRFTAKSQSLRAMGKREFENSKNAVLDIIAEMIGVTAGELVKAEAA